VAFAAQQGKRDCIHGKSMVQELNIEREPPEQTLVRYGLKHRGEKNLSLNNYSTICMVMKLLTYSFPPRRGKYHRIIAKSVKK
jgi:hypothetical protein